MTQVYTRPFTFPILDRPASYDQRPAGDPYSPSEFGKPKIYPSRPHLDSNFERQCRSPMSGDMKAAFEAPQPKAADLYHKSPESGQRTPGEQLPSLSSLFGSSPKQNRPAQSPYSDRQSPVFPAISPLESRHAGTPLHSDRPFEGFYFHRPAPSRHQSYSSRPEPVERPSFAAARPNQTATKPGSPTSKPVFNSAEGSRTQPPTPLNTWSPQHQTSRSEYFSTDTSSSFRPHSDHRKQPSQSHRSEPESHGTYQDQPLVSSNFPPTPASTVAGESLTTKDGLGPKIWTGTQFLPRFVRQAEIPGEGLCYFYDDGTHCKTVIEGEVVNAHWGVTKAGKPRKRLAIACITCREKKIKCDPDYPRCVQCEKFGRICKFKNAPRGGQGSPDTPPADFEEPVSQPHSARTDHELFHVEKRENSRSVSPREAVRQASPESDSHLSKRQRNGYNNFTPVASEASPGASFKREARSPTSHWYESSALTATDHDLLREWQVNPYNTTPDLVAYFMSLHFTSGPETSRTMFPESHFKAWVLSSGEKSLDDLMLIYSILALSATFSLKPEHKPLASRYASIARYACDKKQASIQLVQSRLILSTYYFAINNPDDAWDFCGAAARAATGLRLNLEFEKSDEFQLKTFPFGLNRHGYAECRRRTAWSCYVVDCLTGSCSGRQCSLNIDDMFLRVPCDNQSFEAQVEVQNPYFDVTTLPTQNALWTVGPTTHIIAITAIWGDVMTNVYRTAHRASPAKTNTAFTLFYEKTTQRLSSWIDSLPVSCQFSPENLDKSVRAGKRGPFVLIHALYHSASMNLNRYVQKSNLNGPQLAHHVSVARHHAEQFLIMMDIVAARRNVAPPPSGESPAGSNYFCAPFVGNAIIYAMDILTAETPVHGVRNRLASLRGAQTVLCETAVYWQSGRAQQNLVAQRVLALTELAIASEEQKRSGVNGFKFDPPGAPGRMTGEGMYEMKESMENFFSREYDCMYA